jgi:tetratricopeptide (TPR) repeat protein
MKASTVTQSFKALASKINNQTPLGPKESNRLLTALTSSFRKHLDEVHPSKPHDDGKRPTVGVAAQNTDRHDMHSSAVLAEKHMASLLTNPLLVKNAKPAREVHVKPDVNAQDAAIELNNGANPFDLLESYHAKGRATIDVAVHVMRHFRLSIHGLSYEDQIQRVQAERAGSRVLSWLWNSEAMHSKAYVDSNQMQDGLVWLLMYEGHEEVLWQWLNSDLELPQPTKLVARSSRAVPGGLMWKSRIIYAMVMTKLGRPHREARSADAALEIYFRAIENFRSKDAAVYDSLILTGHARLTLDGAFTHGYLHHYYNTSPILYDKFSASSCNPQFPGQYNTIKAARDAWNFAVRNLWHPTRPKANDLYDMLLQEPSNTDGLYAVHERVRTPLHDRERLFYINTIARAVTLLETSGQYDQATKLSELAKSLYPQNVKQFEKAVASMHAKSLGDGRRQEQQLSIRKIQHEERPQQKERHKDLGWLPPFSPAPT